MVSVLCLQAVGAFVIDAGYEYLMRVLLYFLLLHKSDMTHREHNKRACLSCLCIRSFVC